LFSEPVFGIFLTCMTNFKRISIFICLILPLGCSQVRQNQWGQTTRPQTEIRDWVFPDSFNMEEKLPKQFTHIVTKDQCQLFVFDSEVFSDVIVTTRFKAQPGKEDFGGGILFRYKDPQNYYCLRYNAGTNSLRFYKSIMGDRARFANRTVRLKNKTDWHQLKLVAEGDKLKAYINGKLIFSREDELIKEGKIGLWLRGKNPKTEFADLTIQQ